MRMNNRLASIPKAVIDRLPESMARENTVIPIAATAGSVTIAACISGAQDFMSLCDIACLHEMLEFVLQCKVKLEHHPTCDIITAIDKHYTHSADIKNCEWKIASQCPQLWFNLRPTDSEDTRYCDVCSKEVHYCHTNDSVLQHAILGHCVAIYNGPTRFESIGDVAIRRGGDA